MVLSNIQINPKLKHAHRRVLLEYLRSASRLSGTQWLTLVEAIDLLDESTLISGRERYTFRAFYHRFVDKRFADPFLEALTETRDLEREALSLQASVARRICHFLDGSSNFSRRDSNCQLLLVYCLYWWSAFARGYIFEISIFRDLEASGIAYAAHDVTDRWERLSPYDLIVLDLRGDIKYTTYFISAETYGELTSDFFVTRLYDARDNNQWC